MLSRRSPLPRCSPFFAAVTSPRLARARYCPSAPFEYTVAQQATAGSRRTVTMLGSSNTFDPDKDIPDLAGRVYVVTGGTAGIGFGVSAHLLQHNCARLFVLGKRDEHLASVRDRLKEFGDTSRVSPVGIEFEDLRDTKRTAGELAREVGDRLDGLELNAGIGVGPYGMTADKVDSHMQVNLWAQYVLMLELLPKLVATPDSRLTFQSSSLHAYGTSEVTFDGGLAEINKDIGAEHLYGRSKLAQILMARALHRRKLRGELGMSPGKGPWINATHPGGVATDQQSQMEPAYGTTGKVLAKVLTSVFKDPVKEGCRPMLFATTSDAVVQEAIDGAYIVPDRKVTDPSKQAQDDAMGERLWQLTQTVLREKLGDSAV